MTVEEAIAAKAEIHAAKLYGAGFVLSLTNEKVASACNGCGPESWPPEKRAALGAWLRTFTPAFHVHDCRFTYDNDLSAVKFKTANDELEENCLLLADLKYGWYNPCRYIARHKGHLVAMMCRIFGWSAWEDAYYKNNKNKENT